jgi:hypothetical protein
MRRGIRVSERHERPDIEVAAVVLDAIVASALVSVNSAGNVKFSVSE